MNKNAEALSSLAALLGLEPNQPVPADVAEAFIGLRPFISAVESTPDFATARRRMMEQLEAIPDEALDTISICALVRGEGYRCDNCDEIHHGTSLMVLGVGDNFTLRSMLSVAGSRISESAVGSQEEWDARAAEAAPLIPKPDKLN